MMKIDITPDLARGLQDYSLLTGRPREYLLRRALLGYFEELETRFLAQYPEPDCGCCGQPPEADYWE